MSWDYRVIESGGTFTIHEVHYNDKDAITAISEEPMGPSGQTLEELKDDVEYFLRALTMPVLRREEITFAPMDGK
ncbi:MAG: hypothetical protein EPN25_02970 [Nitrospirae bacterium]|nr:MAG: hypothetical protein EPN25_02970 [Nitrospirota bacterium]